MIEEIIGSESFISNVIKLSEKGHAITLLAVNGIKLRVSEMFPYLVRNKYRFGFYECVGIMIFSDGKIHTMIGSKQKALPLL